MSIGRVTLFFVLVIFLQIAFVLYSGTQAGYPAEPSREVETNRIRVPIAVASDQTITKECEIIEPKRYSYKVSMPSSLYPVAYEPKCWIRDCDKANNYLAYQTAASKDVAEWNRKGVMSMEQYLQGSLERMKRLNNASLIDATYFFARGVQTNPQVPRLCLNLGLVMLQTGQYSKADTLIKYTLRLFTEKSDMAFVHMLMGVSTELQGKGSEGDAKRYYMAARELDESVTKAYAGVAVISDEDRIRPTGTDGGIQTLRDMIVYKYFSRHSISEYALYDPGTQDLFIAKQYAYLRNVIPPFVLTSYANYVHNLIKSKQIQLGDGQSMRYNMYNDRVSRFLHEQFTDLIRRVTAHSVKPSYTYFGGYVANAVLKKHVDRAQCEFTLSLSIEKYPANELWDLAIDKRPVNGSQGAEMGDEQESGPNEVVINLRDGDGLLFMGRRLVHYRKGPLKENQWLNQVFLHYVQEDFSGGLN